VNQLTKPLTTRVFMTPFHADTTPVHRLTKALPPLIQAVVCVSIILFISGCNETASPEQPIATPPTAKQQPYTVGPTGSPRTDEYYWIRDDTRRNPQVLSLLAAENDFAEAIMAPSQPLQAQLFEEITARLPAKDDTVPVQLGNFFYYQAYEPGLEHPIYKRFSPESPEIRETVLDVNQLAEPHDYYAVANWVIGPNDNLIAYAEDTVSRRIYTIKFKTLRDGRHFADTLEGAAPSIAWSADGRSVFYIKKDPETLLESAVYRHTLGTPQAQDTLVYREPDKTFSLWLETSRSKAFILIYAYSTDSSEIRYIPTETPTAAPIPFLKRQDEHEYRVRHLGDQLYFLSNHHAPNYRLMRANLQEASDITRWQPVINPEPGVYLEDFEVFEGFIVTKEIRFGRPSLRVYGLDGTYRQSVPVLDQPATLNLEANPDPQAMSVRYGLSSLKTPTSTLSFNPTTGQTTTLKRARVGGGFDANNYESMSITFTARDGAEVPISLVYRPDRSANVPRPAYLYAYGAYGYSTKPYFRSSIISLLDRGFVFAIIHVRGGQELGRAWYEAGRLFHKRNTFNDFIDGAQHLVAAGLADPQNIFAAGGSAGGLLMGVIANEAPEIFRGIIARVPFVDVITTMLDESIPLTTSEYREWGDPRQPDEYDYMLSYSPYDQVKAQAYPHMMVTTGLFDSQVQYFEPVKWVSRLRRLKTDGNDLILTIDMTAGHSGPSGRYERYQETAMEYAFILDRLVPTASTVNTKNSR